MTTVCLVPGCGRDAVYRGRCQIHQQPAERSGSRQWRKLVAAVVARDRGVCWLCGKPGATSADHIVRASEGGRDELSNLRAAHIDCNKRRG